MTPQTTRILGILTGLVVCLGGAGAVELRHQHRSGSVAIADSGYLATRTAGTASPAGPTDPASSPTAGAQPSAAATTAAAKAAAAKASAGVKPATRKTSHPKSRAEAVAKTPVVASRTGSSVQKGAAVWNFTGIQKALSDSGVSWFYDWANTPNGVKAPRGVEFVPMIWGASSVNASTLSAAKKDGTTLLGFNEPDMSGQANLTVVAALNLWPQLEATKMKLGSPAVAWGADQSGQWLDRFMTGAKRRGYRVDFITLHWYGSDFVTADAVSQLQAYVKATYARYHKPIWITEYSLMNFSGTPKFPTPSAQAAFVTRSTAMLQRLSYVRRYAWFAFPTSTDGADETGLYRPDGVATTTGKAYRVAGR